MTHISDSKRIFPLTTAIVEIGSTGIRLLIAEIQGHGSFTVLDRAGKPCRIGRDVFTTGLVGREAMRECITLLQSFRELIVGYGIDASKAIVIATSALREAGNRDTLVDRILLRTGFKVKIIEDLEENHLMYLGVQHVLKDELKVLFQTNTMILEVGGGSTEILLLRKGKMAGTHSLRIGTVRMGEQVKGAGVSPEFLKRYLQDNVRTACDHLDSELLLESIKNFIVVGSDARLAAIRLASKRGKKVEANNTVTPPPMHTNLLQEATISNAESINATGLEYTTAFGSHAVIDKEDFTHFANQIIGLSVDECVDRLKIPWSDAEGLGPGLEIVRLFLQRTGAKNLIVPNVSIREGVLVSISLGSGIGSGTDMQNQVIASSLSVGQKFHFDKAHARHVADTAIIIFDKLKPVHSLGTRERLLLEVAALLHDVGTYIKTTSHHKHGEYIVANSEIFGLNRGDINIIANIVRYHRKSVPSPTHLNFIALPQEDRLIVMKLAAILRVADALDRGHDQRLCNFTLEIRDESLLIHIEENGRELSLEKLSLSEKGLMFEDVFGMKPIIL